jgi:hypothetical protein
MLEQAMKAHRGLDIYASTFSLTSALDGIGGQLHVPASLPPGKRCGTHRIGGWMGIRAGLNGRRKSRLSRDSIHRPSSP